ncbi:MAG: hypothetical protein H6Q08_2148, partial [Acidobacteria bacterium]|nr:hypothetical protein [Acidobacteriota bacterium]
MKHLVLVPAMVIGTLSAYSAAPQEEHEPGIYHRDRRVQASRA